MLIVDDNSPDGTGDVADALAAASAGRVSVMHRTGLRGLGRSYIDGMAAALRTDADAHLPDGRRLLARSGRAAAAARRHCATRTWSSGRATSRAERCGNWPAHRVMLSAFANWYVRAITRLPVHDCTSGFRCWRRDLLARLPLDRIVSDGYAFLVEMAWEAHAAGGRIVEVPITFVERREGQSKMSGRVIAESVLAAVATGRPGRAGQTK